MKNKQGITIAVLIVAIVGLSIGFAAFSNTLTISSSASVNPTNMMNVVFSSSNSDAETNPIVPTLTPNNVNNFTSTNGEIIESGRTLSNLSAAFTAPGQSVTYNLYVYNDGPYIAYLTDLTMGSITCDAIEQQNASDNATDTLVAAACEGMSVSVTIGETTLTSSGSLNNQALQANGGYVNASVTISYAEGSSYVDGPMSVTIGDITFTASSVAGEVATPTEPSEGDDSCVVTNVKSFGSTCTYSDLDSSGGITKGDKVTCGTEGFYVIETPVSDTVKMLAEWNLNVSEPGDIEGLDGVPYSYTYCASTVGYQDEHVRGTLGENPSSELLPYTYSLTFEYGGQSMTMPWAYGAVKFDRATTGDYGYWTTGDNHDLNTSVYKQNNNGSYPAYVYDNNATLKTYVDSYVGYLNSALSTNATGRLITYEEIEALGCSGNDYTCVNSPATAPAWVYQTSYWSGSARNSFSVWYVRSNGAFSNDFFDSRGSNGNFGVRPVIEISSSVIH